MDLIVGIIVLIIIGGPVLLVMLIVYFLSGGGKMRINEDNPRYQYYDDPYNPASYHSDSSFAPFHEQEKQKTVHKEEDYYENFYNRLDDGYYDDDPEILMEEDPEMFQELYGDDADYARPE